MPTPIAIQSIIQLGQAALANRNVDKDLSSSWLNIALDRDMIEDWARGISRLPALLDKLGSGEMGSTLQVEVEAITPVSARINAPEGHWRDQVGIYAAGEALRLAQQQGIGLVACPKPAIVGAILEPVMEAGYIGFVGVQNTPLMNTGLSACNHVGNNPIAICAPGAPPFLFDGALSRYSFFELLYRAQQNSDIPEGAVTQHVNSNIMDKETILRLAEGDFGSGGLTPIGGIKGLGLAMGMEMLAGALTGGFYQPPEGKPWGQGSLVMVFNPELFGVGDIKERITQYLSQFSSYPGQHARVKRESVKQTGMITYPNDIAELLYNLFDVYHINF